MNCIILHCDNGALFHSVRSSFLSNRVDLCYLCSRFETASYYASGVPVFFVCLFFMYLLCLLLKIKWTECQFISMLLAFVKSHAVPCRILSCFIKTGLSTRQLSEAGDKCVCQQGMKFKQTKPEIEVYSSWRFHCGITACNILLTSKWAEHSLIFNAKCVCACVVFFFSN